MRSCPKSGKAIRIRLVPVSFCLQMEAAAQISDRPPQDYAILAGAANGNVGGSKIENEGTTI
jgi:hypothetical protein